MWMWESQSEGEWGDRERGSEQEAVLRQNDFLKMINLEERYNYFKTLIKLQRMHNYKEDQNEQIMVKVMVQLIEYYAQCISQVQINVDNIVAYFQHKLRDLNYHFKAIAERGKSQQCNPQQNCRCDSSQLGEIPILPLQNQQQKLTSMKSEHNNSLMMAIQNQNIEQHLAQSIQKVQLFKKNIATSIKHQEDALLMRLKDKRKNFRFDFQSKKQEAQQSMSTATTLRKKLEGPSFKRKKEAFSSFHEIVRGDLESESELDQAQSLYISSFNIDESA